MQTRRIFASYSNFSKTFGFYSSDSDGSSGNSSRFISLLNLMPFPCTFNDTRSRDRDYNEYRWCFCVNDARRRSKSDDDDRKRSEINWISDSAAMRSCWMLFLHHLVLPTELTREWAAADELSYTLFFPSFFFYRVSIFRDVIIASESHFKKDVTFRAVFAFELTTWRKV